MQPYKQIPLYVLYCSILPPIKVLFFQTGKEAFHWAVIIRASRFAHTALDPVLGQHRLIAVAAVPASLVTVENQWIIFLFPMKGIPQRLACEFRILEPILRSSRKLNPDGAFIFTNKGEEPMTQGAFASRLKRICRWAGVEFKSLHKIRKTVVTELMDHQLPMPLIQSQVGHASAQTTENCYHFNNKTKYENGRKIASALHDFLPFVSEA